MEVWDYKATILYLHQISLVTGLEKSSEPAYLFFLLYIPFAEENNREVK